MKKNIIWGSFFIASVIASPAIAESYSEISSIKHITLGGDVVRIRLNTMKDITGCSNTYWYALNLSEPFAKEKYSALLAAKATKEKVFFNFYQTIVMADIQELIWYIFAIIHNVHSC